MLSPAHKVLLKDAVSNMYNPHEHHACRHLTFDGPSIHMHCMTQSLTSLHCVRYLYIGNLPCRRHARAHYAMLAVSSTCPGGCCSSLFSSPEFCSLLTCT